MYIEKNQKYTLLKKTIYIKVKHVYILWSSNPTPGVHTKKWLFMFFQNKINIMHGLVMYKNVNNNIVHNSPKWKQPKCPSMEE